MKDASTYDVTTVYGWVKDYPLHRTPSDPLVPPSEKPKYPGAGYGFHTGVDYGAPLGTPVVVNGQTISLSGASGAAIGAHLHLGKFINGVSTNPGSGGFTLNNPKVYDTGEDTVNGKFIRLLDGDGVIWLYDHNSEVKVTKGQKIGSNMDAQADANDIKRLYLGMLGRGANNEDIRVHTGTKLKDLIRIIIEGEERAAYALKVENALAGPPDAIQLKPGVYKVE